MSGTDVLSESDEPRRSNPDAALLRSALDADLGQVPDVLGGVQRRIRQRSGGRFYADGWSTSRHAPTSLYLLTALFMLAVCALVYAVLRPFAGQPAETDLTPAPVDVLAPLPR
jgi:hypothetical protein